MFAPISAGINNPFLPGCSDNGYTSGASMGAPPNGPVPDTLSIVRRDGSIALPPLDMTYYDQAQIMKLYQDMWNSTPDSISVCKDNYTTYMLTFARGSTVIQQTTAEYAQVTRDYPSCGVVIFSATDMRDGTDAFWNDLHAIIQVPLGP